MAKANGVLDGVEFVVGRDDCYLNDHLFTTGKVTIVSRSNMAAKYGLHIDLEDASLRKKGSIQISPVHARELRDFLNKIDLGDSSPLKDEFLTSLKIDNIAKRLSEVEKRLDSHKA